ncbi:MAG: hypothetical protein ACUVQK_15720, partial [Thermogutta sp.]
RLAGKGFFQHLVTSPLFRAYAQRKGLSPDSPALTDSVVTAILRKQYYDYHIRNIIAATTHHGNGKEGPL